MNYLKASYGVSERRACSVVSMHRSSYRHQSQSAAVDAPHQEVVRLSERYPYWGYRKIYDLVDRTRYPVSRERVRLIRRREGLQVARKRRKKRLLGQSTQWVHRAEYPHHVWTYDFVFDRSDDERSLKFLTVVDEFSRLGLSVRCARSLTSRDVKTVLSMLVGRYGAPGCLRSDNGSEFMAGLVKEWLATHAIGTHFIDPGSPWQNAYGESFNSIFRTTCLNRWLFESVREAQLIADEWLEEYNTIRPHGSLGGQAPLQFLEQWQRKQGEMDHNSKQAKSLT